MIPVYTPIWEMSGGISDELLFLILIPIPGRRAKLQSCVCGGLVVCAYVCVHACQMKILIYNVVRMVGLSCARTCVSMCVK